MQRFMLATLISLSLGGCAGMFDDDDASLTAGGAEARISSVPPAVSCISINAVGSRSVTNNFNVTAGQSATLRLSNLPVGSDTFTAFAYPTDCSKIASTQPTWASAAVVATISNGGVTNLALTLSPSGGANVGVSFDTDGGTGIIDGGVGSDGGIGSDGGVGSFDGGTGITDGGTHFGD